MKTIVTVIAAALLLGSIGLANATRYKTADSTMIEGIKLQSVADYASRKLKKLYGAEFVGQDISQRLQVKFGASWITSGDTLWVGHQTTKKAQQYPTVGKNGTIDVRVLLPDGRLYVGKAQLGTRKQQANRKMIRTGEDRLYKGRIITDRKRAMRLFTKRQCRY